MRRTISPCLTPFRAYSPPVWIALPEATKQVLQMAAGLGREIPIQLLQALWQGPGELEPALLALQRLEFLYRRYNGAEGLYVFKHALTQEVAYESLLPIQRRVLHTAAGRALERLYAERLEAVYDPLAYHYGPYYRRLAAT